jgi:hypothetical protein
MQEATMTTEVEDQTVTSSARPDAASDAGPAPDDQTLDLVNDTPRAILELCERRPAAQQEIGQILEEHLRRPLTPESASTLLASLSLYAGSEAANLLLSAMVAGIDDAAFSSLLADALDDSTRSWFLTLLARFGPALREAWIVGGENPEAWRAINRTMLLDVNSGGWVVNVEITKYSGEKMRLEETPSTLLLLATAIVDTLLRMPQEMAPDALDAERRDEFIGKYADFVKLFAPDGQPASTEVTQ